MRRPLSVISLILILERRFLLHLANSQITRRMLHFNIPNPKPVDTRTRDKCPRTLVSTADHRGQLDISWV